METKKLFISITLIPEYKTEDCVLKLNENLIKNFSIKKIEEGVKNYAHISLYNANFPEHNMYIIENIIKDISENISIINLLPERLNIKSKFISVVFKKTPEIEYLQNKIIDLLNPLREGMLKSKYIEKAEFYSERELFYAKTYGYPFCKDEFIPHMTVAEMNDIENSSNILKDIKWENVVCVDKISLRILFTDDSGEKIVDTKLFNLLK